MAKPQKRRPIRMDQFVKQLDEVGVTDLQAVELNQDTTVYMLLGVGVDVEKVMGLRDRVQTAETSDEAAEAILDYHPERSGEEQLAMVKEAGWTSDQIVALQGAATADMRDEMGKLRPKR